MTSEQRTTRQEIADRIMKTLGAFAILATVWITLDLTASVVDPFGVISLLAGVSFLLVAIALLANLVVASSLLRI